MISESGERVQGPEGPRLEGTSDVTEDSSQRSPGNVAFESSRDENEGLQEQDGPPSGGRVESLQKLSAQERDRGVGEQDEQRARH